MQAQPEDNGGAMKIEWMFDLPTDERSQDYHYESPIWIKDNNLYFISCHPKAVLHVIDTETGTEKFRIECVGRSAVSSKCFFAEYQDKIMIYTGELWFYENERLSIFDLVRIDDHINSYILKDNKEIFGVISIHKGYTFFDCAEHDNRVVNKCGFPYFKCDIIGEE